MPTTLTKTWSAAIAMAVFLVVLALGLAFARSIEERRLQQARREATRVAASSATALHRQLDRAVASTHALASLIASHGAIEDFDALARHLLDGFGGVSCLQLAPGGVVTEIYPLEGHEQALGHDLLGDPQRAQEAQAAIESGRFRLSGPVELVQGGRAIIGRLPVFVPHDGELETRRFWGFAIVVVRIPELLSAAGLDHGSAGEHALYLWRVDETAGERREIALTPGDAPARPVNLDVAVADGLLRLAVAPQAGWPTGWPTALQALLALVAALASSAGLFALLHIPERLGLEVQMKTRSLRQANDSLREEVTRRRQAEVELRAIQERLEQRVDERTAELTRANEMLEREIEVRMRAEELRGRLEDRVLQTQKLESLGVLAGGIAHDFNNLLVAILGNASLALLDLPDDSPVRAPLGDIKTAARRAADLTNQLLAYSGRGRLVVAPVGLSELVREMGDLMRRVVSEDVVLRYELADGLPAVDADVTQLRQVVMNLITNASDAVRSVGGAVTVRTGLMRAERGFFEETVFSQDLPEGEYVFLEVEDGGEGMTEETKNRIFDPFFTTKFMGRGLGLAAVMGIVRGHRGAIRIDSGVGVGTTIRVVLPPSTALAETLETPAAADVQVAAGGCVLIVDDDETVRGTARRILEKSGFVVLTAGDGREALHLFRERAGIDVVLLDLTMPWMAGEETLERLRAIRPDVPVLLVSGYTEEEIDARLVGVRPAGFLQKPFDVGSLVRAVRGVLAGSEA